MTSGEACAIPPSCGEKKIINSNRRKRFCCERRKSESTIKRIHLYIHTHLMLHAAIETSKYIYTLPTPNDLPAKTPRETGAAAITMGTRSVCASSYIVRPVVLLLYCNRVWKHLTGTPQRRDVSSYPFPRVGSRIPVCRISLKNTPFSLHSFSRKILSCTKKNTKFELARLSRLFCRRGTIACRRVMRGIMQQCHCLLIRDRTLMT
ncbi:hypothetical protein QTP88_022299 [Uroleucon formosanum]